MLLLAEVSKVSVRGHDSRRLVLKGYGKIACVPHLRRDALGPSSVDWLILSTHLNSARDLTSRKSPSSERIFETLFRLIITSDVQSVSFGITSACFLRCDLAVAKSVSPTL